MVSDELIKNLEVKDYAPDDCRDVVLAVGARAWVDAIDEDRLSQAAKLNLLTTVAGDKSMINVVVRLSGQSDFGIAIAREATSGKRWTELSALKDKHGLMAGLDETDRIKAVGRMLTDGQLLMWVMKILFSKAFGKALVYLVHDRDKSVRRKAISALDPFDEDKATEALIEALDDTDQTVQETAATMLKNRLSVQALENLIAERAKSAKEIGDLAKEAKAGTSKVLAKIPGFDLFANTMDKMTSALTHAGASVRDGASSVVGSIKDRLTRDGDDAGKTG